MGKETVPVKCRVDFYVRKSGDEHSMPWISTFVSEAQGKWEIGDEVFIGVYKYFLVDVRRRLELAEEGGLLEDIQELFLDMSRIAAPALGKIWENERAGYGVIGSAWDLLSTYSRRVKFEGGSG